MKTLSTLIPGMKGIVHKLDGKGPVKRRMMDMGILKGTEILVERTAPLGDPIEIKVRGYRLSLRKSEAEKIILKE